MTAVRACVFDAYGTVFDVHSAVRRHAAEVGAAADAVSQVWRTKQLEYTWVRSLMGRHVDFWACTEDALEFALAVHGLAERPELAQALLGAYRELALYPEVRGVLEGLLARGIKIAVLSNGTPGMLAVAVGAAGLADLAMPLLSVEAVGIYKPDPKVYQLAVDALGVEREAISFQSSNAWDIAGATAFGFRAVWVNRTRQPFEYGLRGAVAEIGSLDELAGVL
jgi:2-haloacid dehalogenase